MDLREKPGKIQTLVEALLRFRLISVVLLVVLTVSFMASSWAEAASLPLGASEALGMSLAQDGGIMAVWNSGKFLTVAAVAFFVLCFVFQGVRGGIASIVSAALMMGALLLLGGAENMPLKFFAVFAFVALVLVLFAKLSIACGLFPFAMGWLLLSGFLAVHTVDLGASFNAWLAWGVLSTLGFAAMVSFSVTTGKLLADGAPQGGALVKAAKKTLMPVVIGSLVAVSAMVFDMAKVEISRQVAGLAYYWIAFVVWFMFFMFPTMSFAPWERLRSNTRRVQMKEKKKPAKK